MSDFPDFDTLKAMAKDNPDALEALLESETGKILAECPPSAKLRLQGLQFKIDSQRKLAKNPVDSMLRIFNMMNESFAELNDALAPFRGEVSTHTFAPKTVSENNVVFFPSDSAGLGNARSMQ